VRAENGALVLPDAPGLGVEIDEEAVGAFTIAR
jgi:L-alanine-DL-glutamate epimerase-like enolase superfamily enzyme